MNNPLQPIWLVFRIAVQFYPFGMTLPPCLLLQQLSQLLGQGDLS
jgi:hypothetical protein